MKKEWKYLEYSDCDRCGGACEVLTESKDINTFYDQEDVRCTECGLTGYTNVDGDEDNEGKAIGSVQWQHILNDSKQDIK